MSDLNVKWESNGCRETSFNRWSESALKFSPAHQTVCKMYCIHLKPQNYIHKWKVTATWVPCLLFSLSSLPGCQHRQVCILRLPLRPQLEMGCFLCYIVTVWFHVWLFHLENLSSEFLSAAMYNTAPISSPSGKKTCTTLEMQDGIWMWGNQIGSVGYIIMMIIMPWFELSTLFLSQLAQKWVVIVYGL